MLSNEFAIKTFNAMTAAGGGSKAESDSIFDALQSEIMASDNLTEDDAGMMIIKITQAIILFEKLRGKRFSQEEFENIMNCTKS